METISLSGVVYTHLSMPDEPEYGDVRLGLLNGKLRWEVYDGQAWHALWIPLDEPFPIPSLANLPATKLEVLYEAALDYFVTTYENHYFTIGRVVVEYEPNTWKCTPYTLASYNINAARKVAEVAQQLLTETA